MQATLQHEQIITETATLPTDEGKQMTFSINFCRQRRNQNPLLHSQIEVIQISWALHNTAGVRKNNW